MQTAVHGRPAGLVACTASLMAYRLLALSMHAHAAASVPPPCSGRVSAWIGSTARQQLACVLRGSHDTCPPAGAPSPLRSPIPSAFLLAGFFLNAFSNDAFLEGLAQVGHPRHRAPAFS